jgi:hypothetical protein
VATIPTPHDSPALEPSPVAIATERASGWHPATCLAFRFCFLYFGLYVIMTQMLGAFLPIPGFDPPDLGTLPPARPLFLWIGTHILGVALLRGDEVASGCASDGSSRGAVV